MSVTIEPGSEWLHIESLTVVEYVSSRVTQRGHEWLEVAELQVKGIPVSFGILTDDFLRDYRPNVPVTPELLEGMGWASRSRRDRRFALFGSDNTDVTLWWCEEKPDCCTVSQDGGEHIYVPFPATLRDLLTLLRVLGVAYTIPEGA